VTCLVLYAMSDNNRRIIRESPKVIFLKPASHYAILRTCTINFERVRDLFLNYESISKSKRKGDNRIGESWRRENCSYRTLGAFGKMGSGGLTGVAGVPLGAFGVRVGGGLKMPIILSRIRALDS
jgi:hypothetical protein